MNEGAPQKENWDLFIKSPEDKKHIMSALKKVLEDALLSSGFWNTFVNSPVDPLDFDDIDDYVTALTKSHPEAEKELRIWLELGELKTIASIEKYSKSKNVQLDIKKIITQYELDKNLKPEEIN